MTNKFENGLPHDNPSPPRKEASSYRIFDPEKELKNIRAFSKKDRESIPDEEKRKIREERLKNFKENLIHQKEGIAKAIGDLYDAIRSAPDTDRKNLFSKVRALAPEYKFTPRQIIAFGIAIEKYLSNHRTVEKYRAMYPNDGDLFEACFGRKPKGKIEVVKGPMTLYFRCYDNRDYVLIFTFPRYSGDETKIKPADVASANESSGTTVNRTKIEDLPEIIAAENMKQNNPYYESPQMAVDLGVLTPDKKDSENAKTQIHEEQHHFNTLTEPLETRRFMSLTADGHKIGNVNAPEEAARDLTRNLVRLERKSMGFDSDARDEILAHYKEGADTQTILENLTTKENYDYVKTYKTEIAQVPKSVKKRVNERLKNEGDKLFYGKPKDEETAAIDASSLKIKVSDVRPHVGPVFKDEYKADLKKWLDAITALEDKHYTRDEIIALLYQEPINSWPNLARRMKTKTVDAPRGI